jgi:hypothetical protein
MQALGVGSPAAADLAIAYNAAPLSATTNINVTVS